MLSITRLCKKHPALTSESTAMFSREGTGSHNVLEYFPISEIYVFLLQEHDSTYYILFSLYNSNYFFPVNCTPDNQNSEKLINTDST